MTIPATLFLIFNRPETTARVFAAIRAAKPPRLYVAADGPRCEKVGEPELCHEARRIATSVDWPCEVKTLFREHNLGCMEGPRTAIDWFFRNETEGIILEDDCLPAREFFLFCGELLERYRSEEQIMTICGSSYAREKRPTRDSYYFSYFSDIWGWATWRRAWALYDKHLDGWLRFVESDNSCPVWRSAPWRREYWKWRFKMVADENLDAWDYQWIYTIIKNGGLACYPAANLVSNIGFRSDATHTVVRPGENVTDSRAELPHGRLEFPLFHPSRRKRSEKLDRDIDAFRLGLEVPRTGDRISYRLRRVLKGLMVSARN